MESSRPMGTSTLELVFEDTLGERHAAEVRRLLESCGDEFVPPLSTRTSTHQTDLYGREGQGTQTGGYFFELEQQPFILALSGARVVAFLSYIVGYPVECGGGCILTMYVTTICADPEYRHRGIATRPLSISGTTLVLGISLRQNLVDERRPYDAPAVAWLSGARTYP